jgi:hypothetical protein
MTLILQRWSLAIQSLLPPWATYFCKRSAMSLKPRCQSCLIGRSDPRTSLTIEEIMIAPREWTKRRPAVAWVLTAAAMAVLLADGVSASDLDLLQPDTIWKGEILQGGAAFATTIFIQNRESDRIKGEIDFEVEHEFYKLTFQGNVIGDDLVVWITDKLSGNVTYPGLYIGKVVGNQISGTWQVPSAGQYDQFSVSLVQ